MILSAADLFEDAAALHPPGEVVEDRIRRIAVLFPYFYSHEEEYIRAGRIWQGRYFIESRLLSSSTKRSTDSSSWMPLVRSRRITVFSYISF